VKEIKLFQKIVGYVVVIGIIAVVFGLILYFQHLSSRPKGKYAEHIKPGVLYRVVKMLDGDTLVTNAAGHEVTVRLIGMDTPEVVDPRKPVQCFGPEASHKAKELLLEKEVYLEKEKAKGDYDVYGRVLAYAHLSSGEFYNKHMIENGFAKEYTFNREEYKYQKEFKEAQAIAKKEKRGMWGACR
jgi:micrococcal nuclease